MRLRARAATWYASFGAFLGRRLKLDVDYVVKGNFWLLIARIVAVGSGMVLTVAFANLLTPETFGFYKYVISVAGIITAFSLTGIGTALINSIARGDEGTLRTTLLPSMLWALPASALALCGSGYYLYHHNVQLAIALVAIAVAMPVFGSFGNYRHLFFGRKDFRTSALIGSVRAVAPIVLLLGTLALTRDPLLIVIAYFASNMAIAVVLYYYTIWRYRVPATAESTESTIRFASFTSLVGILTQITSQADQFLMWHFVGPAGVAFYSFATSPVEQLQSVSGNLFALSAPKLAVKSDAELRKSIPMRMRQMFIILVPFTLAYIIGAPILFHYLFPKYESVVWLSQIYALILLLQPQGFVDAALIAREDTSSRNFLIVTGQVLKLLFLVFGISKFGIVGGVAALILAEVVNLVLALLVLARLRMRG